MRYHSQNLTSDSVKPTASIIWAGRAWLYAKRNIHWEWYLGRRAADFALTVSLGTGDGDDGLMFHFCIPFLVSFYCGVDGVRRCKGQHKTGVAIHSGSFWVYPFVKDWETVTSDPWWKKAHAWSFPWTLDWYRTEILSHDAKTPAYTETKGNFRSYETRCSFEKSVSRDYPYRYELKSGEIQKRTATVHVDRMTWRARWWPIIPIQKIRTSINITFSDEVGDGSGSWKGGCTGCGYEMLHGESPEQTLRRMERERKFRR